MKGQKTANFTLKIQHCPISLWSVEDRYVMGKGPLMPFTNHDRATEIYNAASILSTEFLTLTAGH